MNNAICTQITKTKTLSREETLTMKTVIGIDYGTRSARAVLADTKTGTVLLSHSIPYPHGVMPGDLASAEDYETVLFQLLKTVITEEYAQSIEGICVDATGLTLVPVSADGQALSRIPEFADRHHAQIKLWKCHEAQAQADEALALAQAMQEPFLGRTGGALSSEWALPKLLKIHDEDPEIFAQLDIAFDLCDFLTYRLTGKITRSTDSLCFKGLWAEDLDFPSDAYLNRLRSGFASRYHHLLRGTVLRPGEKAGSLLSELCNRFGLKSNIAVASGMLDGHTSHIALGALREGDAALVVGTSNVLTVVTGQLQEITGICGIAADTLIPGWYGIDSGQSGSGDMLEWYLHNALPASVLQEAQTRGVSPHKLLAEQITRPWENRLTATDWWNGSRNAPCDLTRRGTITGFSMDTKPADIYLALLQAIACGTREIIELLAEYGIPVNRLLATGGITEKNPLLMQEYANILHLPVHVGQIKEGPAQGAAMFAAIAAGIYNTPEEACEHMGVREFTCYQPDAEHHEEYELIYQRSHALRLST